MSLTHEYGRTVRLPGTQDRVLLDQDEADAIDEVVTVLLGEFHKPPINGKLPKNLDRLDVGRIRGIRDGVMEVLQIVRVLGNDLPTPPIVSAVDEE